MPDAYSLILIILFVFVYLTIFWGAPKFFNRASRPRLTRRSWVSIGIIAILELSIQLFCFSMSDPELANRLLHALGGGVLASLTCYLALRDSEVHLSRFQFFVFTLMIVTSLGVGNELLEFALQSAGFGIFSPTALDTWLDLLSNTIGSLVAVGYLLWRVPSVGIEPTSRP